MLGLYSQQMDVDPQPCFLNVFLCFVLFFASKPSAIYCCFYAPEAHILYLTVVSSFLISFVMGGSGRSRAIKFLYAPAHPPLEFVGPQMALPYRPEAISQGPKNSQIPGPKPLPIALVMDIHASKTLCTGLYKSCIR
jgi:hypothetical protein